MNPEPVQRQVGWFGGSFDPPHLAHLALARSALAALQLQQLRWVVAGQPWQKAGRKLAAAEHRAAMVAALIEDQPDMRLDDCELRRTGPSYTLESVQQHLQAHPQDRLWLILGQDQLQGLPSWYGWQELLRLVAVAVAVRGSETIELPPAVRQQQPTWVRLPLAFMDLSSTAVRQAATAGEDLAPIVGAQVAGYIARHRLYREY
ncbi:nicotinate (nicotinamide) nucleotide adenylyltransferase [Roseateles sp. BYS180W]|uniref:nicotinate (nicotinamide) nucleotide adenylyltransferase n=1 Tax=Roseateles rivi TaxID=3299028 RepID=UPI003747F362